MTHTTELTPLIAKLLQKSEAGGLNWSAVENGAEMQMADLVIRITRQNEGGVVRFRLDLFAEGDVLIDSITDDETSKPGDSLLARLHRIATYRLRAAAIDKLLNALERPPSPSPPLVLPAPPTPEEQEQLFRAMAGTWVLDFSRGKETVKISPEGSYAVKAQGGVLFAPKFQLRLIAMNRVAKKIEIVKDYPSNGRRLQIEVLELDDMERPTRMTGEAKHDQHRLVYVREE